MDKLKEKEVCECRHYIAEQLVEKDKDDIVNFGLKNDIDMIALSFTRKGSDIDDVRKLLGPKGIIYK